MMKTIALSLKRHTVTDALEVTYIRNDVGLLPVWTIDSPGTYRATYPCRIGRVPKQITTILGETFQYLVVESGGPNDIIINAMINDGAPLAAELTDYYVEFRVLDDVVLTAAIPE